MISALRGYFRFRTTCGDQVHGLIGVLAYPIKWKLSSLPKALSSAEVERLEASLGGEGPSARRSDAMVRCALDLGLRRGEVAGLSLDDIDWRAGTITLRRTKSRAYSCESGHRIPLKAATCSDGLRPPSPKGSGRGFR
jgi:integrase